MGHAQKVLVGEEAHGKSEQRSRSYACSYFRPYKPCLDGGEFDGSGSGSLGVSMIIGGLSMASSETRGLG